MWHTSMPQNLVSTHDLHMSTYDNPKAENSPLSHRRLGYGLEVVYVLTCAPLGWQGRSYCSLGQVQWHTLFWDVPENTTAKKGKRTLSLR